MLAHDREMDRIARGNMPMPHDNLLCAFDGHKINRQHLIANPEDGVKCRLDGIAAVDGDITVQDFLEDLGIGNQALAVADQIFKESLRVGLVRMRCTHQIHRNVGIDEDQAWVPTPYPLSIS